MRQAHHWRAALVGASVAVVAALAFAPTAGAATMGVGSYSQHNLVSDQAGKAELTDPDLVNPWGLAFGPSTFGWTANNGSDNSTLYSGGAGTPIMKVPLTVSIPGGAPTGAVFNGTSSFDLGSGPALFLFDSEAGRVTGWNMASGTTAQTVAKAHDAIFKGLAIADTGGGGGGGGGYPTDSHQRKAGGARIYATDFHNRKVDVWDGNFNPVKKKHAFVDKKLPKRYAPFGIDEVNGDIVVTYAKQDKDAEDDVAGRGHGFVDVFSTKGKLIRRFASRGTLNSPWGVTIAPSGFGAASGKLLVGNFGDGKINVYKWNSGKFVGQLSGTSGNAIRIDGLWSLEFGTAMIGSPTTLLFTAGPNDEKHGLFGELTATG